jgi:hypothetical protein
MSIAVEVDELRRKVDEFPTDPYLLTVGNDGRTHSVEVAPWWDGNELVMTAGRKSHANAAARPLVVLLWPPPTRGSFSLIVDATATATADGELRLQPTRAVLHRRAPSGTGSDCAPVL